MLKKEHHWQPVYWLGMIDLHLKVKDFFPDICFHEFMESARALAPNPLQQDVLPAIGEEIINQFAVHESTLMAMFQRYDADGISFPYFERRQQYYRSLSLAILLIDKLRPELMFFEESPHDPLEYCLYLVSQSRKIPSLMQATTHVPGYSFITQTQYDLNKNPITREFKKNHRKEGEILLHEHFKTYLNKLRDNYQEAKPWYHRIPKKKEISRNPISKNNFQIHSALSSVG